MGSWRCAIDLQRRSESVQAGEVIAVNMAEEAGQRWTLGRISSKEVNFTMLLRTSQNLDHVNVLTSYVWKLGHNTIER